LEKGVFHHAENKKSDKIKPVVVNGIDTKGQSLIGHVAKDSENAILTGM